MSARPRPLLLAVIIAASLSPATQAQGLTGSIDSNQRIVVAGTGQRVVGLEFGSTAGLLIPAANGDVSPWAVALSNTPNLVSFGSIGAPVAINGSLTTRVGYTGTDPESDVTASWADETGAVIGFPVMNPEVVDPPDPPEPAFSGFINADGKIVFEGTGQELVGYDLNSSEGRLVPIPPGDRTADPAPFQFVLANEPTQIAVGNLGHTVVVDGQLVTQIGYTGPNPETELLAVWGSENDELNSFIISAFDGPICGSLGQLPGDVNGDGSVAFADFLILSNNFGRPGTFEQGDLNCSDHVDFADFLILSDNFGNSVAAAPVPEPNSSRILVMAVLLCLVLGANNRQRIR